MKKILLMLIMLCSGFAGYSQIIRVNTSLDQNDNANADTSLREAITYANAHSGTLYTIVFAPTVHSSTYSVSTRDLAITTNLAIDGGDTTLTVHDYRFTYTGCATAKTVIFKNLTIESPTAEAILVNAGYKHNLYVDNVNFKTLASSGIYAVGTTTSNGAHLISMNNCRINNTLTGQYGICVFYTDTLSVKNSSFKGKLIRSIYSNNLLKSSIIKTVFETTHPTNIYQEIDAEAGTNMVVDSCIFLKNFSWAFGSILIYPKVNMTVTNSYGGLSPNGSGGFNTSLLSSFISFASGDTTINSTSKLKVENCIIFTQDRVLSENGYAIGNKSRLNILFKGNFINQTDTTGSASYINYQPTIRFAHGANNRFAQYIRITRNFWHAKGSSITATAMQISCVDSVLIDSNIIKDFHSSTKWSYGTMLETWPDSNYSYKLYYKMKGNILYCGNHSSNTAFMIQNADFDVNSTMEGNLVTSFSSNRASYRLLNCSGKINISGKSGNLSFSSPNQSYSTVTSDPTSGVWVSGTHRGLLCNVVVEATPLYNTSAAALTHNANSIYLDPLTAAAKPAPIINDVIVGTTTATYIIHAITPGAIAASRIDCYATDKIGLSKKWISATTSPDVSGGHTFTITRPLSDLATNEFFVFTATYPGIGTSMLNKPRIFNVVTDSIASTCSSAVITYTFYDPFRYFLSSANYSGAVSYSCSLSSQPVRTTSTGSWTVTTETEKDLSCRLKFTSTPFSYDSTTNFDCSPVFLSPIFTDNNVSNLKLCTGSGWTYTVTRGAGGRLGDNLTYEWQSSASPTSGFTALSNGTHYSGVSSGALNLINMYKTSAPIYYRLKMTGQTCSTIVYSGVKTLNVDSTFVPHVIINPSNCLQLTLATPAPTGDTVSWYLSGNATTLLSGANQNTYTPTTCGYYYATIRFRPCGVIRSLTSKFGTYAYDSGGTPPVIRLAAPVAEQEEVKAPIERKPIVYPNPTEGKFNLSLGGEIRISTMQGQTVYIEAIKDFNNLPTPDLSSSPMGTYLMTLYMGGTPVMRQTIVKK
ncbi:MAG: T9SS type A sorting domain-containing protein [Bacteroidota bacterium]